MEQKEYLVLKPKLSLELQRVIHMVYFLF